MGVDPGIFCCSAASAAPPDNYKPHHDPNRELHQQLFHSFILYAIRVHEEVNRLERLRIQEAERLEKYRIQANQVLLQHLQSMPDSGPSTPLSFPNTPVSLSPAHFCRSQVMEFPQQPQLPQVLQVPESSGLAAALQLPAKLPDPTPVLTKEELEPNPLSPHSPYVIWIQSRYNYGKVYDHRYYMWPGDFTSDWIEITQGQWLQHSNHFNLRAEKWDMRCDNHVRFFRMTLKPNLSLRGRFSGLAAAKTASTSRQPIPHRFPPRASLASQLTYPMPIAEPIPKKREHSTDTSMLSAEAKHFSYTQAYNVASSGSENVQRQGSRQAVMPSSDVKQFANAHLCSPMSSSGAEYVQRQGSAQPFVTVPESEQIPCVETQYPMVIGEAVQSDYATSRSQVPYFQTNYPITIGGTEAAQSDYTIPSNQVSYAQTNYSTAPGGTQVAQIDYADYTTRSNQFSYAQTNYQLALGGTEVAPSKYAVPRSQVSYVQTLYPRATGGNDIVQSDLNIPRSQISYAQLANTLVTGSMEYVERECLVPISTPTADANRISHLVTDEAAGGESSDSANAK